MICPKCNKDIGNLSTCPDCEAAAAQKAANKKTKIIGLAVFAFLVLTMVLSIASIFNYFNPPEADYARIISAYQKNEESAQKRYRYKRMSFYVLLGERAGDADWFCDKEFKPVVIKGIINTKVIKGKVHFLDTGGKDTIVLPGLKYRIAGYISSVSFDESGNVISISVTSANKLKLK